MSDDRNDQPQYPAVPPYPGDAAPQTPPPSAPAQPGYAPPQPGYAAPPQPGYTPPAQPAYGAPQVSPAAPYGYPIAQPAYGAPAPAPVGGMAITAIILGGLAFLLCWIPLIGLILSVVAVVLGIIAARRPGGRGLSITGIVLGALGFVVAAVVTGLVIVGWVVVASEQSGYALGAAAATLGL
ncbi:hypothetical protein K8F61_16055 [Microbacterium resistens]|uniref:DUF4190 domain-containing protein n=1 Tax=Microbacterium resistens TaxID=156977 RepID=A0ABY3RUK4_9MICO|nr:DUF4190 domain-containing protein [Microbacterium resistens]UGS26137.1 hypothetical protein K8F61_16055 [Microbacterium resistens]